MSRARAAFAFEPLPGATNQLTLTEGDALRVVNTDDREWWWVENAQGSQGYVPGAYVELEPGAEVVLPSLGPSMAQSTTLELEDVPAHRARQRQESSSSRAALLAAAVSWRTGAGAGAAVARAHATPEEVAEGGLRTAACHHSGQVDNNAEEAAALAALAASTVSEAEAAAAAAAEAAARTRELHAAAVAGDVERVALLLRPERRTVKLLRASRTQLGVLRGERLPTVEAQLDGYSERELVSWPFPSWNRSILTEIYLCHTCSYHEIEDGNGRAGRAACRAWALPRGAGGARPAAGSAVEAAVGRAAAAGGDAGVGGTPDRRPQGGGGCEGGAGHDPHSGGAGARAEGAACGEPGVSALHAVHFD
eukprot:COSAG01_NODE_13806_length_1532_cov_5.242149_1_plen_365_part_00